MLCTLVRFVTSEASAGDVQSTFTQETAVELANALQGVTGQPFPLQLVEIGAHLAHGATGSAESQHMSVPRDAGAGKMQERGRCIGKREQTRG